MAARQQERPGSQSCFLLFVWGIRRSCVRFVPSVDSAMRHVDAVHRTLRIDDEGKIHLPRDNHREPHHRTLQETCNLRQTPSVVARIKWFEMIDGLLGH